MALSPDGNRLFVVNTPDNHLEIYTVNATGLVYEASVPVGLEPVAVAARNDAEVWVVNHLSDSVSLVDVATTPPRVRRTLLVGDEPRDLVFAGSTGNRAFITTAHRGQNSPYNDPSNPGELTTPGIGRADVWVFDAANPGSGLGGNPLTIVTLFGDMPRALSVSPDGATVYAAIFHSGNRTTILNEHVVCDGGASAPPCLVDGIFAPGGLPAPNVDANNLAQPEVGLIVRHDGQHWRDELGRSWSDLVRYDLPDQDVFAINANANPPFVSRSYAGVGTVLYNMAVHPLTGKIFVANTEARNEVRFEGTRAPGSSTTSLIGHQHETRISIIDPVPGTMVSRHLNKHIDYAITPAPPGTAENSLALPREMAISSDGNTLYLAAKGSDKIGIFNVSQLENDSFVPDSADHVAISGGGPAGVLLDEARNRLYVTTRYDNGLSVVDTALQMEVDHLSLPNPEPQSLITGRRFLYDARLSSSNGEASCASCHVDGDLDSLAWDLGDPEGSLLNNPLDMILAFNNPPESYQHFHPMKGPMTSQTLRGMAGHGSMHWRGDRTGGNEEANAQPDGGAYNEVLAFKKFDVAFAGLLGRATPASDAQMQAFADFVLQIVPPPNPIRNLDDSLTTDQAAGQNLYFNVITDGLTCNTCHVVNPTQGFFGTSGLANFENESQHFKIPQLRNLYSKVGMFGMPAIPEYFLPGDNGHMGNQIRGFGFMHNGNTDTLFRFLKISSTHPLFGNLGFSFPAGDLDRRRLEQFLFAMDSNLKPVVGQQITLDNTNGSQVNARVDLLIARAATGDADLVVSGTLGSQARNWWRRNDGLFAPDQVSDAAISAATLRSYAAVEGQALTFTAVPPGDGSRIGIDRDEDGVLNGDDNCPGLDNADQLNTDNDTLGDACDSDDDNDGLMDALETTIGTNPLLVDTDGDGLTDYEELAFDGNASQYDPVNDSNPLSTDTDGDGLLDGVDSQPLLFNYSDGDISPAGAPDGKVDVADWQRLQHILLEVISATPEDLAHGDLYPQGAPDGVLNFSDLLLLQSMAFTHAP